MHEMDLSLYTQWTNCFKWSFEEPLKKSESLLLLLQNTCVSLNLQMIHVVFHSC